MRHRGLGCLAIALAVAIGGAGATAGSAQAARVTTVYHEGAPDCGQCHGDSTLVVLASPGERNDISIEPGPTISGFGDGDAMVHITDRGAPIADPRPQLGCTRMRDRSLLCPVFLLESVRIDAGDGDDRIAVDIFSAEVDGGDGNDEIQTGTGYDEVDGGRGTDRVQTGAGRDVIHDAGGSGDLLDGGGPARSHYLGDETDTLDLSARRRGVRVDLPAATLTSRGERDRLRSIENVVPGRGDDTVVGDSHINVIEEELGVVDQGLVGEKPRDSGDDTLIGGGGRDGLASLGGNDRLVGGSGNDRLECNSEHVQRCRITGGYGNDLLSGSNGPDRLDGGPGRDRLYAYAGSDLIFALDRTRDIVDGDRGVDRARIDRRDRVTGVENRLR